MRNFTVGIGCIGSGIGQAVVKSCRLSAMPFRVVGFGTNPFAFGIYDCDASDSTPSIYANDYIDVLIEKCREHKVDIYIPGLDDEALVLSRQIDRFAAENIHIIVSGPALLELSRDKQRLGDAFRGVSNIFVPGYHRETFREALRRGTARLPAIAKPRSGSGSRGLHLIHSEEDIGAVSDDHIFQELLVPDIRDPNHELYLGQLAGKHNPQISEVSIQLVVDRNGDLMGRMASLNRLKDGIPIEILPYTNAIIWEEIEKLYPELRRLGWRGPLNLQGRMTAAGLRLFEMNVRFTGISALRALLGFNEVEACIRSWLGTDQARAALKLNDARFGVRQTEDRAVAYARNETVRAAAARLGAGAPAGRKRVLVTGATGYLGRHLVARLAADARYEVWSWVRDRSMAREMLACPPERICTGQDLLDGTLSLGHVDLLVHCAFARPHCPNHAVAASLDFTSELFAAAAMHQVPAIINISSKAVYGLTQPPPWTEATPPDPDSPYAQAKYAAELLLAALRRLQRELCYTSLRLCSLAGGQQGLVGIDFLTKFTQQALKGEPIVISGGEQQMERLDIRDAVAAVCRIMEIPPEQWRPVYNVGTVKTRNIVDIAHMAVAEARSRNGGRESPVIVQQQDVPRMFGQDTALFCTDTGWKPEFDMHDTLVTLMDYYTEYADTTE